MAVRIDEGTNTFPTVTSVNATRDAQSVSLIFQIRIEGQSSDVVVKLRPEQWETLKVLVDGPKA